LTREHFQAVVQAVERLEEIDPGILKFLSEQFGAKFVSANTALLDIQGDKDRASSNNRRDTILRDMTEESSLVKTERFILVEAGEVRGARSNLPEGENEGTYANRWLLRWIDDHKNRLTNDEYVFLRSSSLSALKIHLSNP
jgi:vacuolar-type H+-ATPase subunit I/STV1